jgi:PcfJ-like protein
MGKRLKFREARRQQAESAVWAALKAHSKRDLGPRTIACYDDFPSSFRQKIAAHRAFAIRAPEEWRCRIKSRSVERRFIDLVRFTFARFPVVPHLENLWIAEALSRVGDRIRPQVTASYGPHVDIRRWHILAAQGASLYKHASHRVLSKAETHHFLTAPAEITCSRQAFWYAVARAQVDDKQVALNISRTKLERFSWSSAFEKDLARYFARHPLAIDKMNDLIDFLITAKREDANFSLKGRTLPALLRRMEEWHRALRKLQTISGGSWEGRAIPDVAYEAGAEHRKAIWRFRQIKTGNDLFREGQRMHHCVASYKFLCTRGDVSIWSLTCEYPLGHVNKGVTIELREDGTIVQCRGFANRLPHANEVAMVKRWAAEHALQWQALERS